MRPFLLSVGVLLGTVLAAGPAPVKVDLTRYDSPEAEAIRRKFDVAGVPTLVFLDGSGAEIPESRIVGYVGPDEFLDHLRSLPAARPVGAPASDR